MASIHALERVFHQAQSGRMETVHVAVHVPGQPWPSRSLLFGGAPAEAGAQGERLAMVHCGRCHVVSEANKFGGIDSTPSFAALRSLADWREKLSVFWTVSPHAAVMQIDGVTKPFTPEQPPPMAPIELTIEEVRAIQAFIETIEPKDLGRRF